MERTIVSKGEMLAKTSKLMRSLPFLVKVAEACNEAYYLSQGQEAKPLFTDEERVILLEADRSELYSSAADKKLAVNMTGFFGVQEAVFAISARTGIHPLNILESLISENPNEAYVNEAQRSVHGIWLESNLHRARVTEDSVMTFDMLPDYEQEKDAVQGLAAAKVWYEELAQPG